MGKKKNMKKATLQALIERAQQSADNKAYYSEFESDVIGMSLTLKKLNLMEYLDMLDKTDDDATMVENLEYYKELIYKSCPIMHKEELQEAYNCGEPYDIVTRIFNDDFGEILRCATAINRMYGVNDDLVESIKN